MYHSHFQLLKGQEYTIDKIVTTKSIVAESSISKKNNNQLIMLEESQIEQNRAKAGNSIVLVDETYKTFSKRTP